jgi:hypothetical protein
MRYAKLFGGFAAGLSIAILATTGAGPALAGPVPAGDDADQLQFNYQAPSGATFDNVQDLPGLQAPATLASQLSAQWGYITNALCNGYIQGQAVQMLGNYTMKSGTWACTLSTNGSLDVSMASPSQLQLSWVTQGNSISFNVNATTSPKITGTFGAALNVDLNVDGSVTGNDGDPSGSPFSVSSESLDFDNANFKGSSFVPGSALQNADNTVNGLTEDPSMLPTPPSFDQMVASTNAFAHQVATALYNTYLGAGASQYFGLTWAVDNNVLVLTLARNGSPPPVPPTGCWISEYALYFQATCNPQQPPGVTGITIMETHLGWSGTVDAYQDSAWTVENSNGQPYADIDAWEFGSTYPTLYLSACSENQWGQDCAPQPTELPNPGDPSNFSSPTGPASPPRPHPPLKPIHPPAP